MVTEAETLRSIQTSHGLTGALNEKRLAEWLTKHNNTDMAYKKVCVCSVIILCDENQSCQHKLHLVKYS